MKSERIFIFDTTLRDGEQSPGATLNIEEKLNIAHQLSRLGVDVIEAGFPVASRGDFEAVQKIAREVKGVKICALARCVESDIKKAADALKPTPQPRIHIFISTSEIHLKHQLRKTRAEVLKIASEMVAFAKSFTPDVEFSPMDASRSELEYLIEVLQAVVKAGAVTLNIPDTVGYATPGEFGTLIKKIREALPEEVTLSVHCHNDLGLATANTLAAIQNGARQVECTINGIGERAGNTALEEIVMSLKTRRDFYKFRTGVKTRELYRTSRMVSTFTGIAVPPNKAIVGSNAFAHESGIHQDALLKEKTTFEIITPRTIGLKTSQLILGKHSGRHAFRAKLKELGYKVNEEKLNEIFERFKELADKKKRVFDDDIRWLVEESIAGVPEVFSLEYISISSGTKTIPTATIRLRKGKKIMEDAACGDGPVDAAYKSVDRITKLKPKLLEYTVKGVTKGKDALGEVSIKVSYRKRLFNGRGTSTDIIEASVKAYLNAINKIIAFQR